MHWAMQYLGQPWVEHDNDCWAFFRRISADHFQRDLSIIQIDTDNLRVCIDQFLNHTEHQYWKKTTSPTDGDAVLMSQGRMPTHVGMWLSVDGGGVLHCVKGAGVIFTKTSQLHALSYNVLGYYSYKAGDAC
ncbi:MAG: hypothetical protein B7X98_02395 [Methylophilaceae bacterium 17-43-7]|nr:MAG: hypothetical protein B7X98_02395 [Methylophilaceae bacterium 17-43-7]